LYYLFFVNLYFIFTFKEHYILLIFYKYYSFYEKNNYIVNIKYFIFHYILFFIFKIYISNLQFIISLIIGKIKIAGEIISLINLFKFDSVYFLFKRTIIIKIKALKLIYMYIYFVNKSIV